METVLAGSPDALIALALDGRVLSWLGGAERLFGWTAGEAGGRPVSEVLGVEDGLWANPEERAFQSRCRCKDGTMLWVDVLARAIRVDGEVAVVAAVRDGTPASRRRSERLSKLSHELRSPLNAVLGLAFVLEQGMAGPLTEEQRQYALDIHTSANLLLGVLNDAVDAAKTEAGVLVLELASLDVAALVAAVCEAHGAAAPARRVRFEIAVDPTVAKVVADVTRLKQILDALVSNAVKFSLEGGVVDVRVRPDGERFRVEVEDRGAGIEPSVKLFGAGTRLALTRRLVEAHGGSLTVISEPGRGSTFFAIFPGGKR